ncbi:MAG: type II toxin-antitoxin system VapC family toxin [Planctomycetes bacterium]|nr:type II toxin-antitoxin system VapC family toxin [Planctomycetota bacterium]
MTALLDTHVLLWWLGDERKLSAKQRRVVLAASPGEPLLVSDITLWEIATLFEIGRIELDMPLRDWLEQAVAPPYVRTVPISPAVAAEVATLPSSFHRDPADRIIVSTARVWGATLLTRDKRIARCGLVPVID